MSFHEIAFSISLEINVTRVPYFVYGMIIIDIAGVSNNIKEFRNVARDMRYHKIEFAYQPLIL